MPGDEPPMADDANGVETSPDAARREEFMHGLVAATPATYVAPILIAANVAVFVAMLARGVSLMNPAADALVRWGANYGPLTTHGQWWRLLSATFVHGGAIHLLMNMAVLWTAGRSTERLFGHLSFTVLYVLTGLAGSVTSLVWHPAAISVGASGAVFGLYGGVLGFLLVQRDALPRDVLRELLTNGATFIVINLAYGFTQPHIDMAAHIGGLVVGLPVGCVLAVAPGARLPRARLWRSALVTLVGVAAAGIIAVRVPIIDDWPAEMARLSALDRDILTKFNSSLEQVQSKAVTRDDFARVVDAELLPAWEAQRKRIAALRLREPERTTARKVAEFMALRAEALRLTAEGYRTDNGAKVREGNLKQEAAMVALQAAMPSATRAKEIEAIRARRASAEAVDAALQRALTAEAAAIKQFNDALGRLKAGTITPDQFADTIEKDLLPRWHGEREAVAKLQTGTPPPARVTRMIEYMSLRGDGWLLTAQAIRKNDAALARKASAKHAEAADFAKSGASSPGSGEPTAR